MVLSFQYQGFYLIIPLYIFFLYICITFDLFIYFLLCIPLLNLDLYLYTPIYIYKSDL